MGSLTLEKLNSLYWLGRYIERSYQFMRLYVTAYDHMIDDNDAYYLNICEKFGIPDTYGSREEFIRRFAFDREDPNSIITALTRTFDNAILMRDEISSGCLSYIHLALAEMDRASRSDAPVFNIQKVEDYILAFWGALDDEVDDEYSRNTVKVGKRMERLDIYVRLERPRTELRREAMRLQGRIEKSIVPVSKAALMHVLADIEDENVDYKGLLRKLPELIRL